MFRIINRKITHPQYTQKRSFWEWVNKMFNQPDESRIKEVGPDRACAEWLLRNGGAVRWSGESAVMNDYNKLPSDKTRNFVEEVDASNSSISHYGFKHFKGCKHIKRITLHKCTYIENQALEGLSNVESPLAFLQISSCLNITDTGLMKIPPFKSLQQMIISDLPQVKSIDDCKTHLLKILPKNCTVFTNIEK